MELFRCELVSFRIPRLLLLLLTAVSLWSFSFGRPFRVDSEEVTVKLPASASKYSATATVPATQRIAQSAGNHLSATTILESSETFETSAELSYLVLEQWVFLCELLAPLMRVLYGCVKISKPALQSLCHQTSKTLFNWRNTLVKEIQLQSDAVPSPEVLFLQ